MYKSASQRGRAAKNKGKRGEREAADALNTVLGLEPKTLHRSQQFCGKSGDADVVGIEGLHIESKRQETLSLYAAMGQAVSDCKPGSIPVVMHRRNHKKWLLIVEVENLVDLVRVLQKTSPLLPRKVTRRVPIASQ
jgi:hypothetical protein